MSTREAGIRERLARLRELANDIMMRISAENQALYVKYQRMNEINNRIAMVRYMGPMMAVAQIPEIGRLVYERQQLMDEINRERQEVMRLHNELRKVENEILALQQALLTIRQQETQVALISPEYMEEERRRGEIQYLLEELQLIRSGGVSDGRRAMQIIRRLRQLGYPV